MTKVWTAFWAKEAFKRRNSSSLVKVRPYEVQLAECWYVRSLTGPNGVCDGVTV